MANWERFPLGAQPALVVTAKQTCLMSTWGYEGGVIGAVIAWVVESKYFRLNWVRLVSRTR